MVLILFWTSWLYCVECPQYSIRLKAHAVTLFAVSRHFNFCHFGLSPFWPYYGVIRPRPLRPSTLWHGMSCHSGRFLVRSVQARVMNLNWFQRKKTESIHPVECYFGSIFLAICNHCGVMVPWSHKTLKNFRNFLFLEKRPLTVKFSKFCSKSFHCDTNRRVVFQFYEIWPTGNRWNRVLFTWQNFDWLSRCRYCAYRAENLPVWCTQSASDFVQIDSLSAEL